MALSRVQPAPPSYGGFSAAKEHREFLQRNDIQPGRFGYTGHTQIFTLARGRECQLKGFEVRAELAGAVLKARDRVGW